jgi:hypothetical protein
MVKPVLKKTVVSVFSGTASRSAGAVETAGEESEGSRP